MLPGNSQSDKPSSDGKGGAAEKQYQAGQYFYQHESDVVGILAIKKETKYRH
ncbi:hypothetical protein ACWJJH_03855 [Endozoicomonadaceae bacterium StTr2]